MAKFLMVSEAARVLKVAGQTVRDLERRGVLTAIRTPTGVRLFSSEDIQRLASEREAKKQASQESQVTDAPAAS
jgi:DNA-binding transcriptional MerR regulator